MKGSSKEDRNLFSECGETLFGVQWKSRMGILLGYDTRRIHHWVDGTRPIPDEAWPRLDEKLKHQSAKAQQLSDAISRRE